MPRNSKSSKDLKELGSELKKLRLSRGLSQDDLENFGINSKHYQDIERGLINPTFLSLKKIAVAFGCTVADLVSFKKSPKV